MTSIGNNTTAAETYEQIRQRNIAANRSLLLSLKLAGPGLTPNLIPKRLENSASKPTTRSPSSKTLKARKKTTLTGGVLEQSQVNGDGRRRSGRIQSLASTQNQSSKEESSEDEQDEEYRARDSDSDSSDDQENQTAGPGQKRKSNWKPPREPKRARGGQPPKRKAKSLKGSRPNPKIFGHQIGTEVGDWWDSRMMCSQAGVHAPPVSGIYGTEEAGCYSVALSGGYEDDVDLGYAFTFTGAGGRALRGTPNNPKNLRTAPQSSDQQFTSVNASLKISCEKGNPVRVIRGFKNHSPFAPDEGYRYDGLYKVEKCWREPGQSGFQVCKFAFVRLPNQPRIPVKEGREAEAEQMYRDMGFKLEDLIPLPVKRQPWTQALAKQRNLEKLVEAPERTKQEHSKEDGRDDSPFLSEPPFEEKISADEATRGVGMDLDTVDASKEQEGEHAAATKETTRNENSKLDSHGDSHEEGNEKRDLSKGPLDSVDVLNQPEMDKEEKETVGAESADVSEQRQAEVEAAEKTERQATKEDPVTADLSEPRSDEKRQPDAQTGMNVGGTQAVDGRGSAEEKDEKTDGLDSLDAPEQAAVAAGSKEEAVDEETNHPHPVDVGEASREEGAKDGDLGRDADVAASRVT